MELANIEKLIEKYLNAETTLQEELTLKNYFARLNIAPHLEEYQMMFRYFRESKEEISTATIHLESKKIKRKNYRWISVAASIALLFSVYFGYHRYQVHKANQQFYQIAKGLRLLSENLQQGEQAVATLHIYEDTVKEIFK